MKLIVKSLVVVSALALGTALHAADAQTNWNKNCKACHGEDGKGQTMMGKRFGCKDYTDAKVQAEMKDEVAFKAIKEGLKKDGKTLMKPFGDKLSDEEIKALVDHMRKFKK